MSKTVFYSWQSDSPNKTNRNFIEDAVEKAIKDMNNDLLLEECPRLDKDTKGSPGSPPIVDTIYKKIESCGVIICDLSFVAETDEGRLIPNPNVLIEYGYAQKALGSEKIIAVMNAAYGEPSWETLPFDMRHLRHPISYNLDDKATDEERKAQKQALVKDISDALKSSAESGFFTGSEVQGYGPTPSTHNKASYWKNGEVLVEKPVAPDMDLGLIYEADKPLVFMHLWPAEPIEPLKGSELSDMELIITPLGGGIGGWSGDRNRYGAISYAYEQSREHFGTACSASTTQIFRSGEIWGVNARMLERVGTYDDFIPSVGFERLMTESLSEYLRLAHERLDYPNRVFMEAGLVNVDGFQIAMSNIDFQGKIFGDVVVKSVIEIDKPKTAEQALVKLFEEVYDAAGLVRRQS